MPGGQRVPACDAHDQAEVRPDEAVFRGGGFSDRAVDGTTTFASFFASPCFDATLDRLRELALFGSVEQRHEADLI